MHPLRISVFLMTSVCAHAADPYTLARQAAELCFPGGSTAATTLYEEALRAIPSTDSQLPALFHNAAQCFYEGGDLERAEILARGAVDMAGGKENGAVLQRTLGRIFLAQGRNRDAALQFERALALHQQQPGSHDAAVAKVMNELAIAYRRGDRLEDAAALFERVIVVFRAQEDQLPVAAAIHNLGVVRAQQGRLKEAERLSREAVAAWERLRGANHPDIAVGLSGLGRVLQEQRRYADAERLLRRALEIEQAAFPPGHYRIGLALKYLGALSGARKRWGDAETLLERSVEILEAAPPPERPDLGLALAELARARAALGNLRAGAADYRRAVLILSDAWGKDDRRLLPYWDAYAAVLREQQEFAEAAQADLQATRIRVIRALRN